MGGSQSSDRAAYFYGSSHWDSDQGDVLRCLWRFESKLWRTLPAWAPPSDGTSRVDTSSRRRPSDQGRAVDPLRKLVCVFEIPVLTVTILRILTLELAVAAVYPGSVRSYSMDADRCVGLSSRCLHGLQRTGHPECRTWAAGESVVQRCVLSPSKTVGFLHCDCRSPFVCHFTWL